MGIIVVTKIKMDTPKIIVHDKVDDSDMVAINMGEEADFPSIIPEEEELSIRVKKSRADRKRVSRCV